MKNTLTLFGLLALATACNRSETTQTKTDANGPNSLTATASVDSVASEKPQNCASVVESGKLDKANEYSESAKPIRVTITLRQDESSMPSADGCVFNNKVEVLATRKSGKQAFKRTLLKDDLVYFSKNDAVIEAGVLKSATYVPTFNSQKYITLGLRLTNPQTQRNTDFTVFMNYYGEIVKVR
ncbi:MAG: hypothetical protein EAZ91_22840 [Cytophagales bacterium]|nr:MAG: hypothetical protein EAZ91_22840 [Cytophagales bacterium]